MGCILSFLNRNAESPMVALEQKCRNAFVLLMAFVWIVMILDLLLTFLALGKTTRDDVIRKAGNVFTVIAFPYGLGRAYLEAVTSDFSISYFIQVSGIVNTYSCLISQPTRPNNQISICLLILIALMNLPYMKLQSLTILPGILIMAYKCSFGLNGSPLQIVEPEQVSAIFEAFIHLRTFGAIPLVMMVIRAYTRAHREGLRSAKVSLQMVQEVADHLVEYNTVEAESTLMKYYDVQSTDHKTWDVLNSILNNLNVFRPYLPNYVVQVKSMSDDVDNNVDLAHLVLTMNSVQSSTEEVVPLNAMCEDERATMQNPIQTIHLLTALSVHRTMSYAMIYFRHCSRGIILNSLPMEQFIDKVYHTANLSLGTVHSCIGNTIHMTWNSVTSVNSPKQYSVAAVRYITVSQRRQFMYCENEDFDAFGSVVSGLGECRIVGSGHRAAVMDIGWSEKLLDYYHYCCTEARNILCEETKRGVDTPTVAIDVLGKGHVVYEMTNQSTQEKYGAIMERATAAYVKGDMEMANVHLEEMLSYDHDEEAFEDESPTMLFRTVRSSRSPEQFQLQGGCARRKAARTRD
eukprot:PhF_6_TR13027/c0_g2_i2/m.20662